MSKSRKYRVTEKHITKGIPSDFCFCPVALALKERFHRKVSVSDESIAILRDGSETMYNETVYDTPKNVAEFIVNFDSGHPVKPFTFEL